MEKIKVLVVEDERKILELLRLYLQKEGYETYTATDGEMALSLFAQVKPDLVVLDLMLPLVDGLEVCRRLRQSSQVPLIMVTAKDEEVDKVIGLSLGADDYLTKPFSPRELMARVKALLRRSRLWSATPEEEIEAGPLRMSVARREVFVKEKPVSLTALEFDLLACLARSPGRVFSRDQLLGLVWGDNYVGDPRVVDVHIGNLRKKVQADSDRPWLIRTVRDVGYKFQADA
ncbi:MAG: response regulator transcription factor [Coprothermobacterota bacterium]|nr:response regulator transcription factor [Coprothermobacterota bacterium]